MKLNGAQNEYERKEMLNCREDYQSPKGITLISLVVTIIVLIILAGVAINLTIGENGLLIKAQFARDEYNNAVTSEEEELNELYAYLKGEEELPENTKDTDAGTIVKLPDAWQTGTPRYISTETGVEVISTSKVSSVYAVSTGNAETVPVPVGFWYVGGKLATGVVISDEKNDKDKYATDEDGDIPNTDLEGNQFVWIPCTLEEYTKCNVWNGTTQNSSSLANASWDIYTNSAEKVQIEKYGGFYIGRYESGTSNVKEIDFTVASTGWQNANYTVDKASQTSKASSKAGEIPYFHANYETALTMSERLYNTNYVASGLITGTQWDVMLNFIGNTSELTSSQWGNYNNTTLSDCIGRYCKVDGNGNTEAWTDNTTGTNKSGGTYTILTTGASETTKRKNLYDVAGNLWEWTQEASYYSDAGVRYLLRGGSFSYAYASSPACFRDTRVATSTYTNVGFRVAL